MTTQRPSNVSRRRGRAGRAAIVLAAGVAAVASGGGPGGGAAARTAQTEPPLDPAQFSTTVDNPLFPASKLRFKSFRGTERGENGRLVRIRVETRVLRRTHRVAGVPVLVVQDRDFEDGELVERTLDYFAQDQQGNVWYFGEDVDDLEDGRVVGHEGQWLAGRRGAKPGLFMPAAPAVGQTFEQERAPRVAEDRSTVLAVGIRMRTRAGTFRGCIKTRDFAPLDRLTETKYYCPRVGLARQLDRRGGKVEVARFG